METVKSTGVVKKARRRTWRLGEWTGGIEGLDDGRYVVDLDGCVDRHDWPGWRIAARFVVDTTERSSLLFSSVVEHEAGVNAPATASARMMHALRPGELHRLAQGALRDYLRETGEVDPWAPVVDATGRKARHRRRRIPDGELAQLADEYLKLAEKHHNPRALLAEQRHLSESTINGRLTLARKYGIYEAAGPGSKGGNLTPYGRKLVNDAKKRKKGTR